MFKNLCSDQQSELLPEKTIMPRSDRYRGEIDPHALHIHFKVRKDFMCGDFSYVDGVPPPNSAHGEF
jgi:hypothetical protein